MEVYTTIDQKNLNVAQSSAIGAETLGFDGIYTLENKHDPFLPLASALVATKNIALSTGIALAFTRSPMLTANLAWDLQTSSGGRFTLGLGPQIKAHNVRRFSVSVSTRPKNKRIYNGYKTYLGLLDNGNKIKFSR